MVDQSAGGQETWQPLWHQSSDNYLFNNWVNPLLKSGTQYSYCQNDALNQEPDFSSNRRLSVHPLLKLESYDGWIAPVFPETIFIESSRINWLLVLAIIRRFKFCWGDIADCLQQSSIIEPIYPCQRGKFHFFDAAPRTATPYDFSLEQVINGLDSTLL